MSTLVALGEHVGLFAHGNLDYHVVHYHEWEAANWGTYSLILSTYWRLSARSLLYSFCYQDVSPVVILKLKSESSWSEQDHYQELRRVL